MTEETKQEKQVNFNELVTWTDEQCEEFDKENHFKATVVRDLVVDLKNALEHADRWYKENGQYKKILGNGEMLGYVITCPECKTTYNLKPEELNFDKEITCLNCGAKYIQNKNIFGVFLRDEVVNKENK